MYTIISIVINYCLLRGPEGGIRTIGPLASRASLPGKPLAYSLSVNVIPEWTAGWMFYMQLIPCGAWWSGQWHTTRGSVRTLHGPRPELTPAQSCITCDRAVGV